MKVKRIRILLMAELNKKLTKELISLKKEKEKLEEELTLKSNPSNSELDSKEVIIQKKAKPLIILSSILGLLLFCSLIYLYSIHSDLKSKETNIESLSGTQKQFKEDLKRKNYTIDSLKRVVLITESKQEKNYGFKNEFKGNVGTVNNIDKVKNLDDLD